VSALEEAKVKRKETPKVKSEALILGSNPGNNPRSGNTFNCKYCRKPGHYKRGCRKWARHQVKAGTKHSSAGKHGSKQKAMLIGQALTARSENEWIVDSGATSHKSLTRSSRP